MQREFDVLSGKGFALIPIRHKDKRPLIKSWQTRTVNDNNPGEFNGQVNVGVVLGAASGNIVDIDLDEPVARALAPKFLPDTGMIFGRAGSPSSHYLYKIEGETGQKTTYQSKFFERPILEYRSERHFTVIPPSVHKSGEQIKWVRFDEAGLVSRDDLMSRLDLLATATLVTLRYDRGKRQNIVLALAGFLLTAGKSTDDVLRVVEAICDHTRDDEKSKRIDAVMCTAEKYHAGKAITQAADLEKLIGSDLVDELRVLAGIGVATRTATSHFSSGHDGASDLTDVGVGAMFAAECSDKIMWIPEDGCIFAYEDGLWHRDEKTVVT